MIDEHWSAVYDSARAVRVNALQPFGFTERQARFLVTVMAHSGSFLERQYCAFTGTARGQNSRDFVAGLVASGYRLHDLDAWLEAHRVEPCGQHVQITSAPEDNAA